MISADENYDNADKMLALTAIQYEDWTKATIGTIGAQRAYDLAAFSLASAQVYATMALAKATMDLRSRP